MTDWGEVYLNERFLDPVTVVSKEIADKACQRIIEKMEREIMKPDWAQK